MIRKLACLARNRPFLLTRPQRFASSAGPDRQIKDGLKNMKRIMNPSNDPRMTRAGLVAALVGGVAGYYCLVYDNEISFRQAMEELRNDRIQKIEIVSTRLYGQNKIYAQLVMTDETTRRVVLGNVNEFIGKLEKAQYEKGKMRDSFLPLSFRQGLEYEVLYKLFMDNVSTVMFGMMVLVIYKSTMSVMGNFGGGKMMGMKKSQFKVYGIDKKISTRFKDVAGQEEAKQEIEEFVHFLKNPEKFSGLGARIPRGALLTGPPGTGKTLLAKAVAGEAGVPFFTVSGSEFVEMFAGVGASRVRDLFKQAKEKKPAIIFVDEIDAIGKKRAQNGRSHEEKDNTLNQLLVEMDGFSTSENIVVLAATNQKNVLDPALTRPGRFDRMVEVGLSDIKGRKEIFMVHLKPLTLRDDLTMEEYARRLATLTPGFSGAEIANLCNEAAILAARQSKNEVDIFDFEMATEKIIGGLEKKRIVSKEERRVVAVHESGHAVVSWMLSGCMPLLKLTIIPRSKGSLGFAQYLPSESGLQTKEELLDQITFILGGRMAEQHFFKQVTTGAHDDLMKAQKIAYNLVTKFGMSEQIGMRGFKEEEYSKNYSEATQQIIDQQVHKVIEQATQKSKLTVEQYSKQIEALSEVLLEKETLDLNQITAVLGERPFPPKSNFKEYLEVKQSNRELSQ